MKLTLLSVLLLLLLISVNSEANVFVVTSSDGKVTFDQSRYPSQMSAGITILNNKCGSCHSLARIVNALETGQTAAGLPFNKLGIRQFVIRKMRRPEMNIDTQEAAELLRVMQYMLDKTP